MISMRRHLIISLLSALAVVTILTLIVLYYSAKHEMYELYSENMQQIALAIANQNSFYSSVDGPSPDLSITRQEFKGEEEYLIQVWHGQDLQYASLPAVTFPLQKIPGHGTAQYQDQEWFYFRLDQGEEMIQISQPRHKRFEVVWEINGQLLLPILLQLPLLALLVWAIVGQGTAPLWRISKLIEQRNPHFLDQINEKGLPKEIHILVAALNDLLARLGQALQAQSQFTGDAAHELRTPLTAVKIQLDLLKRAVTPTERQEAIESLSAGIDRSMRMVEQLLSLAYQEYSTPARPFSAVALKELIERVCAQYHVLADNKKIQVRFQSDDQGIMNGDPENLVVLISNLLNNAIVYTPPGGTIELRLKTEGDHVVFEIKDSGVGIDPKEYDRIFDRFYRIHNVGVGSGLGLSIVKKIADQHGARIRVGAGIDGVGASFNVQFPALEGHANRPS